MEFCSPASAFRSRAHLERGSLEYFRGIPGSIPIRQQSLTFIRISSVKAALPAKGCTTLPLLTLVSATVFLKTRYSVMTFLSHCSHALHSLLTSNCLTSIPQLTTPMRRGHTAGSGVIGKFSAGCFHVFLMLNGRRFAIGCRWFLAGRCSTNCDEALSLPRFFFGWSAPGLVFHAHTSGLYLDS